MRSEQIWIWKKAVMPCLESLSLYSLAFIEEALNPYVRIATGLKYTASFCPRCLSTCNESIMAVFYM
jgi:hypothetical protein